MADNIVVTPGTGKTVLADEVVDATLGTGIAGYAKIMDGTLDSSNKLIVTSAGAAKVDGSAVTQPVSLSSSPLPTGAATSANQTNGTQTTKIVNGANTLAVDSSGFVGVQSGGTTGTAVPTRALQVAGSDGTNLQALKVSTGGVLSVDASATTQPVSASSLPLPSGAATSAAQATGNTSLASIDTKLTSVTLAALPAGTNLIGDAGTQSATNTPTDAISNTSIRFPATASGSVVNQRIFTHVYNGTSWDRMRGDTTGSWVVNKQATTGGLSIYRNISLLATGGNIKGSAGQVFGYFISNLASSVRHVKFYDKATAPTVGTDVPVLTLSIPANGAANIPAGTFGIQFANGIGVAATTGIADSDTTAPAANDIVFNVWYA